MIEREKRKIRGFKSRWGEGEKKGEVGERLRIEDRRSKIKEGIKICW